MSTIRWEVFTKEEKQRIDLILNLGKKESLVHVIEEMTQEKELELQKIVSEIQPFLQSERSAALKNFYMEHPDGPQTPEEEAGLQKQMDEEIRVQQEEYLKKNQEYAQKMQKIQKNTLNNEERVEVKPEEEIKEEAKVKFCEFCDSKGVKHLKTCSRPKLN